MDISDDRGLLYGSLNWPAGLHGTGNSLGGENAFGCSECWSQSELALEKRLVYRLVLRLAFLLHRLIPGIVVALQ